MGKLIIESFFVFLQHFRFYFVLEAGQNILIALK